MRLSRPHAPAIRPRHIANWLIAMAVLVFCMIVVGGITRLTESGLSMVTWEPISGIVPPLNTAQWMAEFDAYRATPEYLKVNRGMTLAAFQGIFFWEYLHRVIGRLIGIAFALPLLWFWWRRAIPKGYGPRLAALLALGGLQGAIGWWMVASGLVDRPDVSHLRLATHLSAALFIFSGMIWTARDLRLVARDVDAAPARLRTGSIVALAIVAVQIIIGALVAGLDAGYAFSSWPMMGDSWFPAGGWRDTMGVAANLIDNPIVVQFVHRWFAWIAAGAAISLALRAARTGAMWALPLTGGLVAAQIALGIGALLSGVAIPIAAAHQAVGALLLAALVACAHRVGSSPVRAASRSPRVGQVLAH
ncbi:COX15/CtaA family protein [Sphingomonas montana]|uniref:COX15/CtaA family protein n=1 Tax=Sphingomonas montana TaxID=1843236 RepID=UPI00096F05BA|nr:COX15/CtaA family protein [Sphingomonas montana]